MAAYYIFLFTDISDRSKLEMYWRAIGPTLDGFAVKPLVSYAPFEQMEGDETVRAVVLLEFDSMTEIRRWYDSEKYHEVRKLRWDGSRGMGLMAEAGTVPPEMRFLDIDQWIENAKDKSMNVKAE